MIWWLSGFIALSVVLGFVTWNLLRQNDEAEDYVAELEGYIANLLVASQAAIANMQVVDESGAFEADDEIGVTFQALREVIADYAEVMGLAPADEALTEQQGRPNANEPT